MWNSEARDSSSIIFTFMSSWERIKMLPSPGKRRTRSNGAGKFTAVEDFARYSVEAVQEAAAAGKDGGGTRAAAAGKEGNKG
jgi:hypothetical protein